MHKSERYYYYTKKGMYRVSNHWGRLTVNGVEPMEPESDSKLQLGFAPWTHFIRIMR
jgi:hypothetical protein